MSEEPSDRLQKLLAAAGAGSRRKIEARIAAGDVRLNGKVAELGAQAVPGDVVEMDDKRWEATLADADPGRVLLYHKPMGEVTTRDDPEGRPTVFDRLPYIQGGRWVAVGRLDMNTTGLLLLTDDGELANALMHPRNRVDREYACRIHGEVPDAMMQRLRDGVELEDGRASFSDITPAGDAGGANRWFHVTILEGRNREVRRLWESQGVEVSRLKRVRYGAVFLPSRLRQGRWEELPPRDVATLRRDIGLPARPQRLTLQRTGRTRKRKRRG